jgi:hypothetical protein
VVIIGTPLLFLSGYNQFFFYYIIFSFFYQSLVGKIFGKKEKVQRGQLDEPKKTPE